MQRLSFDNLDDLTCLTGLADRTGVDIRPTLLRVLTDLYIQKPSHSPAEERHYTELALRLIDVVDPATRATVAEKLAGYAGAPFEVVRRLEAAAAFAKQQQQPEDASTTLAVPNLLLGDDLDIFEPDTAPPPRLIASDRLSLPATPSPADYVVQREEFFAADSDTRRLILQNLVYVAKARDKPLADGTNVVRFMEQAVLAGRLQEFATLLQQTLGTSRISTARIVQDVFGEPFAVSAKALAMPKDVFQRILIFLNPSIGHSVRRVYELSDLFARLPISSALHLVTIWREADRADARATSYRALHWADPEMKSPHAATKEFVRPTMDLTTPFGRRRTSANS